jgi:photosystem II stability/assembly factor-like uncharacterized protein
MVACVAPNGPTEYRDESPCTRLHVGTADGVVTLTRDGAGSAWKATAHTLPGRHISSLLFEPKRGGLFAGVHDGGLWASVDGGQTWQRKMQGISEEHVFTLASAERDGQIVLYAGTEPAHLFESRDYGETWRELSSLRDVPETEQWTFPAPPNIAHVKNLTFDPRDDQLMYACIEQGALLKTTDGGQTWRELSEYSRPEDPVYRDIHRLVQRPSNPDEMYFTGGAGLYYSADGGETWEHLSTHRARIGYPDALMFSPDESLMFMAGSACSPGDWRTTHDADAAVGRSRDGGRTWEILTQGLPAHIVGNFEAMTMASWPGGFTLFAATTDGDVFASEDGGESWATIASDLAPISKGEHYVPLRRPAVGAAGAR